MQNLDPLKASAGYKLSLIFSAFSLSLDQELIMINGVNVGFSALLAQSSVGQRKKYKKYSTRTYIGLIAYAIQDSPDKRLTFKQIMKKLEPFVFGDKKGIENNIRVCLSSNRCFAKVPVDPDYPNPKKNFWKVDESGITPKMFRRHFKYIMNMLPGLSLQAHREDECEDNFCASEHLTPVCAVTENKNQVKFTGPFSIESILKSDREVKRMRNTRLEEHPRYIDAQCGGVAKRGNFYDCGTVECYYPVSAVRCQLVSAKRPRLSPGAPFRLSLPPQITYDHPALLRSPLMYDTRSVRW